MEHVGSATGLDAMALETGREADRERLRGASREGGGPEMYLQATHPRLAKSCPPGLSESALVAETTGWYGDAEARLGLCATCPPSGGACDRVVSLLPPGHLPVWQGERVVPARCERFREWRLGQRLAISDVPERYRGCKLTEFPVESPAQQEGLDAVKWFFDELRDGGAPWLVVAGPSATGKTYLGCAMLRDVPRAHPRKRFWYSDMHELRVAMKGYKFDSDDEDPTERLRSTELLVLDNMDPSRLLREAWLHERVADVLYQRWNRRRATLLTTHESVDELVAAFPTITTFSEVPRCSLV